MHLDPLDVAILRALAEDVRRSLREVAALVGTTPTTVSVRLEHMKAAGVVQGGTLRFDPARLPGRARVVEGRVARPQTAALLEVAAGLAGVVEAAVTPDGRLVVVLQVLGFDDEEAVVAALADAGGEDLRVSAAHRVTGPPLVHLFEGETDVIEKCAICGKEVGADVLAELVDGRRVAFCCTSCRRAYQERYERMRDAAAKDPHSTTS